MSKEIDNMSAPFWIEHGSPDISFPDVTLALSEPDGLLAIGGDLSQERLLNAYRNGIFPWYTQGQPILWWSPDPRFVLYPKHLKISRNLRKTLRRKTYSVTLNQSFESVISACSSIPRPGQEGTWITEEIRQAYIQLHQAGYAHSVESWDDGQLVGGLYGITIGRVFFGESMFSKKTDASKVAFACFVKHIEKLGIQLIDCQVYTAHLESLGAEMIPRSHFIQQLTGMCASKNRLSPAAMKLDYEEPSKDD